MGTKRPRGVRHPIEYTASELGVDRKRLVRALEATGKDFSQGVTFREAFDALTLKSQREADRDRRMKAEADSAEMTAAEKRGQLMLTENHRRWVSELATQTRVKVKEATHLSEESKKKLCNSFAEIQVER